MTNLVIAVNNDIVDSPYNTSGVIWTAISIGNDFIIFTNGSPSVANGQPIPSSFQLSSAGVLLNGNEQIIPGYLLADISANQLKTIYGMGNLNNRYVIAFNFDGVTTSEPILEAWDNISINTVTAISLGNGTPSASWLKGVVTTDALPGTNWSGSALAGSSDGHFLWLNNLNGALTDAKTLYCNLKMIVPATQTTSGAETPILTVKYTTT